MPCTDDNCVVLSNPLLYADILTRPTRNCSVLEVWTHPKGELFNYGYCPACSQQCQPTISPFPLLYSQRGTTISQVYAAMSSVAFAPFSVYPEYLKGGGGHHSGDGGGEVPSSDVTLIVSIVDTYDDDNSYSTYDTFLDNLFSAMYSVSSGACMDDHDTDPHVSMARGVKFKSSYHQQQYMYNANLEVAVWQAMYPKGTPIGSNGYASFPAGSRGNKQYVGYGNLYFFFDRANITKAFSPYRDLTDDESYYATLYTSSDVSSYYSSTTNIGFDYSGSGDGGDWEHNPYSWKATMAMHDMTDGWTLPPNCEQEGETFFGIPLSRKSDSNLQASSTFQTQFNFENIVDRNNTYIKSFGTNHGWLVGEQIGNGAGSIVDKDTAHIPIFYTGTTNPNMVCRQNRRRVCISLCPVAITTLTSLLFLCNNREVLVCPTLSRSERRLTLVLYT